MIYSIGGTHGRRATYKYYVTPNIIDHIWVLVLDGAYLWSTQKVHMVVDKAFHQRAAIVVLDEPHPAILRHHHLLAEALLLEVANGKVVCICEKVFDAYTTAQQHQTDLDAAATTGMVSDRTRIPSFWTWFFK
jgi:hypothetical protein